MGKVKITNDPESVYEKGQIVEVKDLIESYCDCCTDDNDLIDWLWRIPAPSAIAFIADAWGLEYEFV